MVFEQLPVGSVEYQKPVHQTVATSSEESYMITPNVEIGADSISGRKLFARDFLALLGGNPNGFVSSNQLAHLRRNWKIKMTPAQLVNQGVLEAWSRGGNIRKNRYRQGPAFDTWLSSEEENTDDCMVLVKLAQRLISKEGELHTQRQELLKKIEEVERKLSVINVAKELLQQLTKLFQK